MRYLKVIDGGERGRIKFFKAITTGKPFECKGVKGCASALTQRYLGRKKSWSPKHQICTEMKNGNYFCRQQTSRVFRARVDLDRFAQTRPGATAFAGGPTVNHVQLSNGNFAYPTNFDKASGKVTEWQSLNPSDYAAAMETRPNPGDW